MQEFAPNCWLAPEFDALKLHREMTMLLNGRGGHIEQTFLYLDHHSAAAWCAIAEQDAYTSRAHGDADGASSRAHRRSGRRRRA